MKWISVDDSQPIEHEYVLIEYDDEVWLAKKDKWEYHLAYCHGEDEVSIPAKHVIWWMKLPKTPKMLGK